LKTGSRFSRSAASASRWSSLWKVTSASAVEANAVHASFFDVARTAGSRDDPAVAIAW